MGTTAVWEQKGSSFGTLGAKSSTTQQISPTHTPAAHGSSGVRDWIWALAANYATAAAMLGLNPLHLAGDQTRISTETTPDP